MNGGRQGRLLVVDFDFFFPNPFEGLQTADRGDPTLYDWAHTEAEPFLLDGIWTFRAEDFYRAGITPPRCEGLDNFWDRFTFTSTRPPLFYADSNVHAGRLTPAHFAFSHNTATAWQDVHLFDAHHDSGYPHEHGPQTFEEWRELGEYSCEDWMLVHHANGSRLRLTYPVWRPRGDSHPPMIPLEASIDDRSPVPAPFDAVFLCRSGTWVPSWCDDQFTQLLQAFPGRARPFPGVPWTHPRPDPLPQARRHAALFAEFTAGLAAPQASTPPADAPQPSPDRKAPQDMDISSGTPATHSMTQPTAEDRAAAEAVWAQRKQRALELITPDRPADGAGDDEPTVSLEEFRALCGAPDVQQKAAGIEAAVRQRMEQTATVLATSLLHGPASRAGRPDGSGAAHRTWPTQTPPPSPGLRP
ncbi:hypothetical protein [Streptomyces flaveolus]|uniref:hypothetical protein n=1 Tax=Streptomyces flaveolus TaxID=67297 RepID=UPI0036FB8D4A